MSYIRIHPKYRILFFQKVWENKGFSERGIPDENFVAALFFVCSLLYWRYGVFSLAVPVPFQCYQPFDSAVTAVHTCCEAGADSGKLGVSP